MILIKCKNAVFTGVLRSKLPTIHVQGPHTGEVSPGDSGSGPGMGERRCPLRWLHYSGSLPVSLWPSAAVITIPDRESLGTFL